MSCDQIHWNGKRCANRVDCTMENETQGNSIVPPWAMRRPLGLTDRERNELRRENRSKYSSVLSEQIARLITLGYPEAMRVEEREFRMSFKELVGMISRFRPSPFPDPEQIDDLPDFEAVVKAGNIPLLLVFPLSTLGAEKQMNLVRVGEKKGRCEAYGPFLSFSHISYLAMNVGIHRNFSLEDKKRCVIQEGIAVATQCADFLRSEGHIAVEGQEYTRGVYCISSNTDVILFYAYDPARELALGLSLADIREKMIVCEYRLPSQF